MAEHDIWRPWPIWSAVFVGALSALAVGLIIGLIGYAVGAHQLSGPRSTSWSNVRMISAVFSILGAFFAFVAGGWIAARIAGFRRAEPAMLHGAVVWLLTIPAFLVLGAFGATAAYGGWYGGITSSPAWMGQLPAAGGDVLRRRSQRPAQHVDFRLAQGGAQRQPLVDRGGEEDPAARGPQRPRYLDHAQPIGVGLDRRGADGGAQPRLQQAVVVDDGAEIDGQHRAGAIAGGIGSVTPAARHRTLMAGTALRSGDRAGDLPAPGC